MIPDDQTPDPDVIAKIGGLMERAGHAVHGAKFSPAAAKWIDANPLAFPLLIGWGMKYIAHDYGQAPADVCAANERAIRTKDGVVHGGYSAPKEFDNSMLGEDGMVLFVVFCEDPAQLFVATTTEFMESHERATAKAAAASKRGQPSVN